MQTTTKSETKLIDPVCGMVVDPKTTACRRPFAQHQALVFLRALSYQYGLENMLISIISVAKNF